jgi:hypothetical protein
LLAKLDQNTQKEKIAKTLKKIEYQRGPASGGGAKWGLTETALRPFEEPNDLIVAIEGPAMQRLDRDCHRCTRQSCHRSGLISSALSRLRQIAHKDLRHIAIQATGLLYHESDLRIEEHYTDTAGFTDHVFALMHLLGFRFVPRLRDLGETKLYVPKQSPAYSVLKPMIGGTLQIKSIRAHWNEILRLATSIKRGAVTASLMLRKLGSYPR